MPEGLLVLASGMSSTATARTVMQCRLLKLERSRFECRAVSDALPEEIFKYAGELIYRFQLLGGPIQPYYSRPGT